jgi:hypothetical protein
MPQNHPWTIRNHEGGYQFQRLKIILRDNAELAWLLDETGAIARHEINRLTGRDIPAEHLEVDSRRLADALVKAGYVDLVEGDSNAA